MTATPPRLEPVDDTAALVARARAGDIAAFENLAQRHVGALIGLAQQTTHDRHIAEDVAQDALLLAYRSLAQLDDPEKFAPWLYRIAIRQARRISQRRIEIASSNSREASSDTRDDDERRAQVRRAVGELEEPYRLVVTLRYLDGLNSAEIAKRLNIPDSTVRTYLSRAMPLLQQKLERYL
jgi:RNA polymerase sigma-70 factor, ECF subfamily